MSNKKLSATEISKFQNERLQDSLVVHNEKANNKLQLPSEDVVHVASQQKLEPQNGRFVSHCHLLVRIDQQRAVCRYCGQSFPLMPSGELDKAQLIREALSRPLFGRVGRCQM